jgi:hypothetical protein
MIEITNIKQGGELKLGIKGKDGKSIVFTYGMVINENIIDKVVLEDAMKNGLLASYLNKKWCIAKKVNVQGAIIGAPTDFKGISDKMVEALENKQDPLTNRTATEEPTVMTISQIVDNQPKTVVEEVTTPTEVKAEENTAPATTRKKGRPAKTIDATKVESVEAVDPQEKIVVGEQNIQKAVSSEAVITKTEPDDFI